MSKRATIATDPDPRDMLHEAERHLEHVRDAALSRIIDRLAAADRSPAEWYRLQAQLRAAREDVADLRNATNCD
jgi:hypothetical protein